MMRISLACGMASAMVLGCGPKGVATDDGCAAGMSAAGCQSPSATTGDSAGLGAVDAQLKALTARLEEEGVPLVLVASRERGPLETTGQVDAVRARMQDDGAFVPCESPETGETLFATLAEHRALQQANPKAGLNLDGFIQGRAKSVTVGLRVRELEWDYQGRRFRSDCVYGPKGIVSEAVHNHFESLDAFEPDAQEPSSPVVTADTPSLALSSASAVGERALSTGLVSAQAVVYGWDWMNYVQNKWLLSDLSIPGTHDSGARRDHPGMPDSAAAQKFTITEQLNAGVRYLDIRCAHIGNHFYIYHGIVDQLLPFQDVLNAVYTFLINHPSESIIMSVKHENITLPEAGNSRSFTATFRAYTDKNSHWYRSAGIPQLGSVRGKVVLLRRFGGGDGTVSWGINAYDYWPDNGKLRDTAHRLWVQDHYDNVTGSEKWNDMQEFIKAKKISGVLYLNYGSAYVWDPWPIPNLKKVSDVVNRNIASHFSTVQTGERPYGVIIMDRVDNWLPYYIWKADL